MALNQFVPIPFTPSAGMSSDLDPLSQQQNFYQKAQNIHIVTQGGNTTIRIEPTLGNVHAYDLPTVTAQNKKFRIYLAVDSIIRRLRIYDANRTEITTPSPMQWANSVSLNVSYSNAKAIIQSQLNLVGQTYIIGNMVTETATTGYFDFTITTVPYWNYIIRIDAVGGGDIQEPIVIDEAIDPSLAGQLIHIGSKDLVNDLFLWSTPQTNMPESRVVTTIMGGTAGAVRLNVDTTGIAQNSAIYVSGSGSSYINGTWIADVGNGYIDLLGSIFTTAVLPFGEITINIGGVGEIGIARKDEANDVWRYTTLLRSSEWNFRTKKQPKTDGERNNINASLYWTDNYNPPRVFYYNGDYIENGGLNYVDSDNTYFYGSIAQETRLLVNTNNFGFEFIGQDQTGGGVLAGNHRYALQFLTENFVATPTTEVSNPINVFSPTTLSSPNQIGGNYSLTVTGKINNFLITNIQPNVFKWVELIDIYYQESVPVGVIVRRDLLTQNETQTIQHTGNEQDTRAFDLAELSSVPVDIQTALNLTITENRLVLSNITTANTYDFSAWAQTFKHAIKADSTIPTVGTRAAYRLGEYLDPINVYNKVGYMHNEIYRFGVKLKLKNGAETDTFWVDDIRIDTIGNNAIANPTQPNRRLGALINYDLTDQLGSDGLGFINVAYVEFSDISLDYLIEGMRVRDLVDSIEIMRVDISENEALRDVLATGVVIKTVSNVIINTAAEPQTLWTNGLNPNDITGQYTIAPTPISLANFPFPTPSTDFFEYYGAAYWHFDPAGDSYPENGVNHINNPQYAFLYSPDELYGLIDLSFRSGDVIVNMGSPDRYLADQVSQLATGSVLLPTSLAEFDGAEGVTWANAQKLLASNLWNMDSFGSQADAGLTFYKRNYYCKYDFGVGYSRYYLENNPSSPLLKVENGTQFNNVNTLGNIDAGLHYIQYTRPKGSGLQKYGDPRISKYIPTGFAYDITVDSPDIIGTGVFDIFGGDTFTQKSYLKNRLPRQTPTDDPTFDILGGGSGFGFYSQNRVNSQMKNSAPTFQRTGWDYPYLTAPAWLEDVDVYNPPAYNTSYTIKNGVTDDIAFDSTQLRATHLPTHIPYSDLKPNNSLVDSYRVFLPLNYRDENLSMGEITHQINFNRHLMTFQPHQFVFQYFNETGVLTTTAGEATLGNAGIMTRKGEALTQYGTKHGFSVINGKTDGGKDCVAWIDTTHKKVVQHDPSSGTTVISERNMPYSMRYFFNKFLSFADGANTPADGSGICGVYDTYNGEFIWTVRAHRNTPQWFAAANYKKGDAVHLKVQPAGTYTTFEQTIEIYVAKSDNVNREPEVATDWEAIWEKVSHDDPNYFNEYTISYSKVKDKWSCYFSYAPKIYMSVGSTFLAPRPVENQAKAYEYYGKGARYCVWFTDPDALTSDIEQAENWFVDGMTVNQDIYTSKHWLAVEMLTKEAPYRMEFRNDKFNTFIEAVDFEERNGFWIAAVKNNIENGVNDDDSSGIFGNFVSVKIEGLPDTYNDFYSLIIKAKKQIRYINT